MLKLKFTLSIASLLLALGMNAQTDSLSLGEVVVTGTRSAIDERHLPMTVTSIGRKDLISQNHQNVLPSVMQQVPSILVTERSMLGYGVSNGAAGGINLRGISGGAGQLLVLIDGQPQYNGIYGHPISDAYQTIMAERVEVLRGPASVLYGSNAMGGVINIVTRRMDSDGMRTNINLGAGSYGTIQIDASNQVRHGRFSSTVSGQYARTDNHRPGMGFEQYGGFLKLGYDISDNWKASLNANLTHFNASYPGSISSVLYDADQWITRGNASVSIENNYALTNGAIMVYSNFGRHKIDDGTNDVEKPTTRYFRSKDALTGITAFQSVKLFEGNRVTAGIDYQHIYGNAYYTSKETGDVIETPNKQSGKSYRNEIAGYIDVRQDIIEWLTLDVGVRIDHHSVSGTEWVPQTGMVIRPISTGEIKLQASKGFRNPTMRELYLYPPSNEDLKPERLWNYELSWKQRVKKVNYRVNVFFLKADNLIQTIERKNVNLGEIENYGLESELSYIINDNWSLITNHSFLHMKEAIVTAPTYKGYYGVHYSKDRWQVIAGLQHVANLYTQVGEKESKESFALLNASISYQVNNLSQIWLRGDNLLAQRYEYYLGYPMPRATFMAGVNISF